MTARLRAWRRPVLAAGALAGVVFMLAVMDMVVGGRMQGKTTFPGLPGSRLILAGDLSQPTRRPETLRFRVDIPGAVLTVIEVKGRFWRGELHIPADTAPGTYRLHAVGPGVSDPGEPPACRIVVYASGDAMRAVDPSFIRRALGIAPWWIAIAAGMLLTAGLVLSHRIDADGEALLTADGLASIVKLASRNDHWELAAPLPAGRTMTVGTELSVVDRKRQPVGRMTVTGMADGLVLGRIDRQSPVTPDGFVRLPSGTPFNP